MWYCLKEIQDSIRKVVFWNRKEYREHDSKEIKLIWNKISVLFSASHLQKAFIISDMTLLIPVI